jgi:hypothetical protein
MNGNVHHRIVVHNAKNKDYAMRRDGCGQYRQAAGAIAQDLMRGMSYKVS